MKDLDKNELPIAVIDSGVGGISVLRHLIEIMPNENYLYFGDSANAPYGSRTKEDVLNITRNNLKWLQARGIKALVIACNTATSAAVRVLREENPDLIITGIEPAVKPASLLGDRPRVLVMATPLTLKESKFLALAERFSDVAEIIPLPCPSLAELIETGEIDGDEIALYIQNLFEPYQDKKIDAIVLGCTHYPHIRGIIERHAPNGAKIFDGGEGTARYTQHRLEEEGLLRPSNEKGRVEIINSSPNKKMLEISEKLLYK